ncbi:MAG: cytochrome b N-terminal domain-containing protein [Candidatus Brocadiales bacterium]
MSEALGGFKEHSGLRRLIEDNFFKRLLPRKLSWFRCLGGLALVTFAVQVGSGLFLVFFYVPSAAGAFNSVQHIKHAVPYGWLICKLHLVGTQIMIGCVIAHLIRVLFKGAYKSPRQLYWVSGAFLLMLTLLMGYTGTKLPVGDVYAWNMGYTQSDTPAYASPADGGPTTVVKYKAGVPPTATKASTGRYSFIYIAHVAIIPVIICSFMAFHFIMIRRTGISEPL